MKGVTSTACTHTDIGAYAHVYVQCHVLMKLTLPTHVAHHHTSAHVDCDTFAPILQSGQA